MFSTMSEILETHYIESRRHRRYALSERGTLDGVPVEVLNISRGGAQVAFWGNALGSTETLHGSLLRFELLVTPTLSFPAEVIYENRRADEHVVGVKFVDMSAADLEAVDSFLFTLN